MKVNPGGLVRAFLVGASALGAAFLPGCSGPPETPTFQGGWLPDVGPISDCTASQLKLAGAYHPSMLVDPAASVLTLKVAVGETRTIRLTSAEGEFCNLGILYDPTTRIEWRSSNPSVATVSDLGGNGVGEFGEVHGVGPGTAHVSVLVDGAAVTRMTYYCCGTCESPEPPPRCVYVPIDHVEVVAE